MDGTSLLARLLAGRIPFCAVRALRSVRDGCRRPEGRRRERVIPQEKMLGPVLADVGGGAGVVIGHPVTDGEKSSGGSSAYYAMFVS